MGIKFRGIKCDNTECDFIDMSVKYEDYNEWLNKPCPDCGANLLTEADFKTCKRVVRFSKIIGFFVGKKGERVTIPLKMNGSGKIRF